MSRRRSAGLASFALAPILAVGVFFALAFAVHNLVVAAIVALAVAAVVAALGSRRAGYGGEGEKVAGWTIGSLGASAIAIMVALAIAIAITIPTCEDRFR